MVDFREAYNNNDLMEELKRKMDSKHYPPRYQYEIVDLTEFHNFFMRARIVKYHLKGGKVDDVDGEREIHGDIVIPSLTG